MPSKGHTLFQQECEFRIGATKMEHVPADTRMPEVAFAGRSNVGKSSLLNALTFRKSLARTSKKPGCTRQLNFFSLNDQMMLVDLPGYGYAQASKKEVAGWNRLFMDYLVGRPNLHRVFVLIDARHGVKPNDKEIMTILDDAAVSYQVVLTKTDKQKADLLEKIVASIGDLAVEHTALHPEVVLTSSRDHVGLDGLRDIIAAAT